ncbi:Gfo/Idh/MocA family protein [Halegenticoccus soli]|uniref:Gfo/Idh/MocA family protein n=1 Tax=Halegenticoccus soli TaxID=1985678 RepID=UPI000C6D405F|nr:Gfo/Idh/MocA family oxidoreductase [Halegenticoccus soli]
MRTVAIVGRGRAIRRNAERYECIDDVAVGGLVTDAPTEIPEGIDAPAYGTLDESLRELPVDAVDVCGPAAEHRSTVRTALEAGLSVRCDPPLAYAREDLDSLVSTADASDGRLVAASVNRFSRLYGRMRDHAEGGGIGSLGVARIKRTAPSPDQGWNAWYVALRAAETPGTVLGAVAAHDFDVLRWLFGPIDRVFARAAEGGAYDHVHVLLRFENGAKGQVEVTWSDAAVPPRVEIELAGDHGVVRFTEEDAVSVRSSGGETIDPAARDDDCYARMLRAFVNRSDRAADGAADVSAAAAATRAVLATRRSIAEGRPVSIDEVSA